MSAGGGGGVVVVEFVGDDGERGHGERGQAGTQEGVGAVCSVNRSVSTPGSRAVNACESNSESYREG